MRSYESRTEDRNQDEQKSIADALCHAFGDEEPTTALRRKLERDHADRGGNLARNDG
jgi:hypothetical protein